MPRARNAAPSVDFPYPQSPRNATASPSMTTAVACSGSVPRDNSENDRTCPSRYVVSDSSVAFSRAAIFDRARVRRNQKFEEAGPPQICGAVARGAAFEPSGASREGAAGGARARTVARMPGRSRTSADAPAAARGQESGIAPSRTRPYTRYRLAAALTRRSHRWPSSWACRVPSPAAPPFAAVSLSGNRREPSAPARGMAALPDAGRINFALHEHSSSRAPEYLKPHLQTICIGQFPAVHAIGLHVSVFARRASSGARRSASR